MGIRVKKKGEYTVLTVDSRSLAGDEALELKKKALEIIDSGNIKISLDLITPEYIDSSGVGKLLFLNKKLEKLEGEFSIIGINKTLFSFLDSLAITKVIKVVPPE
ncbi:MAG: STAS domain-containing protein [Spirochaetales bacterium]|nr:STAS domain-containing protein [Spirochaetales bacterium]